MNQITILITATFIMFSVIGGLAMLSHFYNLNGIKSRTVGDGQHGVARFATKQEIRKTYKHIPYKVADWRNGVNLPTEQGIVLGCTKDKLGNTTALVDTGDVHALMIGASGIGKTAFFLYPNLEYACASGMSWICTDTKGDLAKNYGGIAKDKYGYKISVLDLRNPTRSDGNNLLHLVNKYMDIYKRDNDIISKTKAEKYAKIISKTIINSGNEDHGQNAFFYDSAEGLLTAVILLTAEYLAPKKGETDCRHIVSVFKLVQELVCPSTVKNKSQFQILMEKLPNDHKAKWFSGAALHSAEQAMLSVLSTVLSRLNSFLDTAMEQILCFDTEIDAETFCNNKSAVFIILPEEDNTKYFMVSLFLQQFYREMLQVADEHGGALSNRVMIYADEIGTIPKIDSFEMMLSAGRSRKISVVPIIQSFAQLEKNYGKEGSEIITDNTQVTIFGGFAPNSQTAEVLSKVMGNRTVMSGTVTRSKDNASQQLQMSSRALMTPDELKSIPKGNFIVMKTGTHPMKSKLKLFHDWGITFEKPYVTEERVNRKVFYADKDTLEKNIIADIGAIRTYNAPEDGDTDKGSSSAHTRRRKKNILDSKNQIEFTEEVIN